MDIVEVRFKIKNDSNKEEQLSLINSLLGAYRQNGQVIGREFKIFQQDGEYVAFLSLPDTDSLANKYNNKYVDRDSARLNSLGLKNLVMKRLGKEPQASPVCKCDSRDGYILYTSYLSLESPLRCFNCFGTVPLYHIPKNL